MPEYLRYPLLILVWVVTLMSGTLSILREVLLIYRPNQTQPRSLFWNCVVIAFVVSAAILWAIEHQRVTDEHARVVALSGKLDALGPKLVGEIGYVGAGTVKELAGKTSIIVVATITNLGGPSIVRYWGLTVVSPSGNKTAAENLMIPKTITMSTPNGPRIFHQEDALYNKTIIPIPTGGAATGILVFTVPGGTPEELMAIGTQFILEFADVAKKPYSCSFTTTGHAKKDVPGYIPGLKPF